jgi:hypothetical protein
VTNPDEQDFGLIEPVDLPNDFEVFFARYKSDFRSYLGSPGTSRRSVSLSRCEACEARRTLKTVRSTALSGRWVGSIRV